MKAYQQHFIEFLISSGALTFGEFVTKSGRKTPYFVNTGNFNSGSLISQLGSFYADHIVSLGLTKVKTIFGPAYKGIPLCVATVTALALSHKCDLGFSFDRKEVKDHGDGGTLVGKKINPGDAVLIVEDVITAGTTLRKVVPYLKQELKADLMGVIIAVDRCERGNSNLSAVQEARQEFNIEIHPLITVRDILAYEAPAGRSSVSVSPESKKQIEVYLGQYGVKE